jgi:hypothetical protein
MIGVVIALVFAVVLIGIVRVGDRGHGNKMLTIIMVGYVLRLLLQTFVREVQFFTHDAGGDCGEYEMEALEIARIWQTMGISFMTSDDLPFLSATVLPQNAFAAIIYCNGGEPTRLGCTALIAFASALTCFNIYQLALEFGAAPTTARRTITLFYLGPTFLHYTSDMFKDGLVACLAIGSFAAGLRLMQRVTVLQIVIGAVSLWGLWYVRYYLAFVTIAPLVVGVLGIRSKTTVRPLFAALAMVTAGLIVSELTDATQRLTDRAAVTYEIATSEHNKAFNAMGGSGVTFDDDGRRYGQLWLKTLYTVFSPFPWGTGSIGFHVGKIDVLIICFFLYRGWIVARTKELMVIALMAMTFVVPCTVMYATSMSNVGLIARQRLVIVLCFAFLASLYRPEMVRKAQRVRLPRRQLNFAADSTKSPA